MNRLTQFFPLWIRRFRRPLLFYNYLLGSLIIKTILANQLSSDNFVVKRQHFFIFYFFFFCYLVKLKISTGAFRRVLFLSSSFSSLPFRCASTFNSFYLKTDLLHLLLRYYLISQNVEMDQLKQCAYILIDFMKLTEKIRIKIANLLSDIPG